MFLFITALIFMFINKLIYIYIYHLSTLPPDQPRLYRRVAGSDEWQQPEGLQGHHDGAGEGLSVRHPQGGGRVCGARPAAGARGGRDGQPAVRLPCQGRLEGAGEPHNREASLRALRKVACSG